MTARVPDVNGWIEVKRNPISRVGVFDYSGRQLGMAEEPEASRIYKVLRPAEELGNPETIDSFRLLPWVDEHAMLGPEAQKIMPSVALPAEQKGIGGVIGQDVEFDGQTLFGNIKVFSDSHNRVIQSGKVDLSAGYRCKYDMTPGLHPEFGAYDAVQRNIRGNHLASVKEGRMGPSVAVMDSFTFTFDSKDATMADGKDAAPDAGGAKEMTLPEVVAMLKQIGPQIAELQAAMAGKTPAATEPDPVIDTATPAVETPAVPAATDAAAAAAVPAAVDSAVKIAMDSMTKTLAGIQASVAAIAKTSSPGHIAAAIADRDSLARRLTPHIGTFDHVAMDSASLAAYGAEKLGLKAPKGQEIVAVEAYLYGRPAPGTPVRAGTGMDSANVGALPTFLSNHFQGVK